MKQVVNTDAAPAAVGPYSQAVRTGDFLFVSGQVGLDPASGSLVEGGLVAQVHQTIKNLTAIIEAAGGDLRSVVKTTVLLQSIDDPCSFLLYEAYETEEAAAAHKSTSHYLAWRDAVANWMAEPRRGVKYSSICP